MGSVLNVSTKSLPDFDIAPSLTLIVETVYTCHISTFVITAQKEEILREFEFVAKQEKDRLQALLSAVHVIAQEEIIRIRRKATHFEHAYQICVLPMYISNDLYGWRKFKQSWLA